MLDYKNEQLLTVKETRKLLPGRPAIQTVIRWMTRGVRGIVLESLCVGARRFTSVEAVESFLNEIGTAQATDKPPLVKFRGARQMARDSKRADQVLQELGFIDPPAKNCRLPDSCGIKTYIAQSVSGGPIKIGKSMRPKARVKGLNIGHPETLRVLVELDGDCEAVLMERFSGSRIRGEWFVVDDQVSAFLRAHGVRPH